ncbi:hypothetical protein [Kitasatospora camelliae]|uniref:Uncharacterized protein n=1 Tax=Kitasatospora camelliae TaxID=3156397 RepID=A0AAU8K4D3_9ACTN
MSAILPMTIPAELLETHQVGPTDELGLVARHAVATAAGDTYVMSMVGRYRSGAPDAGPPATRNFWHSLVTRYAPDGTPTATAVVGDLRPDGSPSEVVVDDGPNLALLPDGHLALTSKAGSTHLLSPDLSRVSASWTVPSILDDRLARTGDPFAASITVTSEGRLLCMASEYGLGNWAGALPNLVAVSDPGSALTPGSKATLRAIASLTSRTGRQTEEDLSRHILFAGAPVGRDNRPSPSLTDLLNRLTGSSGSLYGYEDSRMTRPAALGEDLFVVPVFGRTYRSGSRGQEFSFALLDDQGALLGRLEGLDRYRDSPFTGFHYTVVADPYRSRAFHLNRYGLYAWSADRRLRSRISTDDKPFTALKHFTLLECTPAGELLLVHGKQHLVLRVPVPEDLADLPAAVAAALKGYGTGRTVLKKRYAPADWRWVDGAAKVSPPPARSRRSTSPDDDSSPTLASPTAHRTSNSRSPAAARILASRRRSRNDERSGARCISSTSSSQSEVTVTSPPSSPARKPAMPRSTVNAQTTAGSRKSARTSKSTVSDPLASSYPTASLPPSSSMPRSSPA